MFEKIKSIFYPFTEFEKALVKNHVDLLAAGGIPFEQALKLAENAVRVCIKESKKNGTYYLPENLGEIFLGKEKSMDSHIQLMAGGFKSRYELLKRDDVREKDVIWWWGLNDVERRLITLNDEGTWMGIFIELLKRGATDREAGIECNRTLPVFGNPKQTDDFNNDDRPLPFELHDRVTNYVLKNLKNKSEITKKETELFSSFNSFVREKINSRSLDLPPVLVPPRISHYRLSFLTSAWA